MTFLTGKNNHNYKHGGKGTRLYGVWRGAKRRCDDPKQINYQYYGGKGIRFYSDWYDFSVFKNWAEGSGYSEELYLDRINSNENYAPENCRWVDWVTQANNRSSNRCFIVDGESFTIAQLARKHNLPYTTLINRLNRFDSDFTKTLEYGAQIRK